MQKKGLSGYWLKVIAVITMLIDHTAATILEQMLMQLPEWGPIDNANWEQWYVLYLILRGIGRMAFPIYCFLLVEGFTYTRNKAKYAMRLFVFALISEVPFDLALNDSMYYAYHNNVFFTLLIGLLMITAADYVREKLTPETAGENYVVWKDVIRIAFNMVILLAGSVLAEVVLHCDYGASGVLAIFVIYMFREQRLMGFTLAVVILGLLSSTLEFAALLMLIPIYYYDGTRGRQVKYFFYAFYPVHLLALALICYALGLG